jgi:TRAP-type C4-dicarboxylate transport system permease small subunit
MKLLRSLDAALAKFETALLVVFLGSMVLLAFAQVVLRNLFDTGFVWGDTIVRHLVLWAGFIGGALAAFEGRHIGIDALTKFLSPRMKHVASVVTSLFGAVACFFLAKAALTFTLAEREAGGELVLNIPGWVAMVIIPFGYALIMIHFSVKVVEHAAAAIQNNTEGA